MGDMLTMAVLVNSCEAVLSAYRRGGIIAKTPNGKAKMALLESRINDLRSLYGDRLKEERRNAE